MPKLWVKEASYWAIFADLPRVREIIFVHHRPCFVYCRTAVKGPISNIQYPISNIHYPSSIIIIHGSLIWWPVAVGWDGPWMKSLGNRRSRGLPSAWLRRHIPVMDDQTIPNTLPGKAIPVSSFQFPLHACLCTLCLQTKRNYQG